MADQSTYPPPARLLPQSSALAEAEPLSIQELFSRNPEGMADRHIDIIVGEMRALRTRLEATGTPVRQPRAKKEPALKAVNVDMTGFLDDC